ncbi:CapA family protein [Syntrophomonas erecta]
MKRWFLVLVLLVAGMVAACFIYSWQAGEEVPVVSQSKREDPPERIAPRTSTIVLTAAGDCLMHNTQIWSGKQREGSYDFSSFFREVKPLLQEGDYTSTTFEAPMAGPESGFTGYPAFNSPDEIADTFKEAGFDLIVTSNNHALDRGYRGALRTLEVLRSRGLDTVGTYSSEEESRKFLIKDIKGVKVGYLAYSYGTNGIPVPEEHPYFFNFLDREKILTDIQAIRSEVDVLMLVLHWGVEYSPRPTQEQVMLAHEFIKAGADVILGSHPHVIQTMEIVNIGERTGYVIYSMGNFISHQRGQERNSGIVLRLQFTKDMSTGITVLDSVTYTPTYSHSYSQDGKVQFRVVPVEETIKKIQNGQEPVMNQTDLPLLQNVLRDTQSRLGQPY